MRFVDGVEFDFTGSEVTRLAPGEYLLLVQNRAAFEFRYGTGLPIAGEYAGRFSNAGERVAVVDATGRSLIAFTFGTSAPWPGSADGTGPSLTLRDLGGDPSSAENWVASVGGGTPGWGGPWGALRIEYVRRGSAGLTLGFTARAGKAYVVMVRHDWTESWSTRSTIPAEAAAGLRELELDWDPGEFSAFFQLMELP